MPPRPQGDLKPQNVLLDGDDMRCLVRGPPLVERLCACASPCMHQPGANSNSMCALHLQQQADALNFMWVRVVCTMLRQLTDFGIARSLASERTLTSNIGTAQFMPPEALNGTSTVMMMLRQPTLEQNETPVPLVAQCFFCAGCGLCVCTAQATIYSCSCCCCCW